MTSQPPDQPLDNSKHLSRRACRLDWMITSCLLIVHAALAYMLVFVNFGFDHPGEFGLDFDDFIHTAALFLIITIWGLVRSCRRRRWWLAVGHTMLLLSVVLSLLILPLLSEATITGPDKQKDVRNQ